MVRLLMGRVKWFVSRWCCVFFLYDVNVEIDEMICDGLRMCRLSIRKKLPDSAG